MKKKNIVIIILTIINIMIIALCINKIIINEQFSRRKLRQLYNSNSECVNYTANMNYYNFKTQYNDAKEIKYKEDRYQEKSSNGTMWYIGNKVYVENTKEIIELDDFFNIKLGNLFNLYMYIDNDTYEYQFIKKEKKADYFCWVIELKKEEEKHRFWIESNTGIVLKEEIYEGKEKLEEYQYKVTINNVTQEELKIPNLEQYHIQEK